MKIKMLVMDVDGTLTDGGIYMGNTGELMKVFSAKDGYGIEHMLPKIGVTPVIITGRASSIVQNRARELKIAELFQGVGDKLTILHKVADRYNLQMDEIAYIGDDLNDLDCMKACGYTGCPRDAAKDVRAYVDYVCSVEGGSGAVREFIELLSEMAQAEEA